MQRRTNKLEKLLVLSFLVGLLIIFKSTDFGFLFGDFNTWFDISISFKILGVMLVLPGVSYVVCRLILYIKREYEDEQ